MKWLDFFSAANADYIEQLYAKYKSDPSAVEEAWAIFFTGFEMAANRTPGGEIAEDALRAPSSKLAESAADLVHSYRELGHFIATVNPLGGNPTEHPLLSLPEFGFSVTDLDTEVGNGGFMGPTQGSLRSLLTALKSTYCGTLGVEYMGITDKNQRTWLQERMEPVFNRPVFMNDQAKRILSQLVAAESFEQFLHTKYIGQKRFSLEGGEALIPMLEAIIDEGAALGMEQFVLGMSHRGRLNVLAHVLQKPYEMILSEFQGTILPDPNSKGDGDVKYHMGFSSDRVTVNGTTVHCSLAANPSHLELVDPVIEGMVAAKQHALNDEIGRRVVPVLVHGEAAFTGQGIVPETLNLSELKDYRTGGTIHIIVNNQVGFTATSKETRFTPYPTDVAKMIQAPVFHVNGDDPEAVVHAARLAIAFRQQFNVDVFIDLWCFRKYGHNETDDPTFTQPQMYEQIAGHPTVGESFAQKLVDEGKIETSFVDAVKVELRKQLDASQALAHEVKPRQRVSVFQGAWQGMTFAKDDWAADTAVSTEQIAAISRACTTPPDDFTIHPKLKKLYALRQEMSEGKRPIDWGCGEMWAFGSLLLEGTPVRLAGQDSGRGTFSHRHAVLHDYEKDGIYIPLQHLSSGQAPFVVVNSMLSELAVLGFEYGYSTADPRSLVLWEAQFGDFVNGAQPIIDQFIASSESKWQRMCGLVMLLPHGYEGQGPEHSSARLERFLQGCADENWQVCYPTHPAQYFHLLRRQMHRRFRKPLILMMPKSLLRYEKSTSSVEDFTSKSFQLVLDDPATPSPETVERVLFCTGKVFFTLTAARKDQVGREAIVRLEQLYPFPEHELRSIFARYANAKSFTWVQEEPRNMGAWTFIQERLPALLPNGAKLEYVGRDEASSPATGMHWQHEKEEHEFISSALGHPADADEASHVMERATPNVSPQS